MNIAINNTKRNKACYICREIGYFVRTCLSQYQRVRMILRAIELRECFAFAKAMQELKEGDFINDESKEEPQEEEESFVNPQAQPLYSLRKIQNRVITMFIVNTGQIIYQMTITLIIILWTVKTLSLVKNLMIQKSVKWCNRLWTSLVDQWVQFLLRELCTFGPALAGNWICS